METAIWKETPSPDNPFQADECFCYGYNVAEDLLTNASWIDYLFLLISGRRPNKDESNLLEKLCILLANPGVRDLSVRAAMNAGVAKAPSASTLIAALSVGSGQIYGARELVLVMELWKRNFDLDKLDLTFTKADEKGIWPELNHIPGFDPHASNTSKQVKDCLNKICEFSTGLYLPWLKNSRKELEKMAKRPLSLISVIAAGFCDLRLSIQQSEFIFLMSRLPGAAAHAMEQEKLGWRKFPFFADTVSLESDAEKKRLPNIESLIEGYINEPK